MVFDDDVKLVGLYNRYRDETEEFKNQIIQYICSDTFESAEKNFTFGSGESELADVSFLSVKLEDVESS